MLKLSKIIKEGLTTKYKRNKEEQERDIADSLAELPPKPESPSPLATATSPATGVEPTIPTPPAETAAPVPPPETVTPTPPVEAAAATSSLPESDEAESLISLIGKEIESLELTTDAEKKTHQIGNLATIHFQDLEGHNPLMAAAKIRAAVKEALLKKYDVKPEELEEKLEEFKKKFRAFGTYCYVNILKQRM